MPDGALAGLKVVEYGRMISAPFCSKLLGDLGAGVIKIESPGVGDESRRYGPFLNDVPHPERSGLFLYLNTNKQGITLDVTTTTGRRLLKQLLEEADVFVVNDPLFLQDSDFSWSALKPANPRLIIAAITPFGLSGPHSSYRGYHINSCAVSGLSIGIGDPGREPLTLPLSVGSYVAGLGAALGIMFAALAREATGEGQLLDISEAEVVMLAFYAQQITTYIYRGVSGLRSGRRMHMGLYPNAVFPVKDGDVCLDIPQLPAWIRFLELIGTPEWTKNPRYRDRRAVSEKYPDEVDALLAPWLTARTKQEVFDLCQEAHIPCAPIMTIDEVVNNRHLNDRGFFNTVDHPIAGTVKQPGAPYDFSQTPWQLCRPAPILGEHNEEIYCKKLGYSPENLVHFRRAGVI